MVIRERIENMEKDLLSPFAKKSKESIGRKKEELSCSVRTNFQRDRDRILHCNAFRRLKHKTQVFISPEGDHYRTRLTHTLEVSQIARTIARALKLNEDLTEAISLGHDIGHTPFGHKGEEVLDRICDAGFKHSQQSVKVVEILENNGLGLNLTYEVIDGIKNHTGEDIALTLEGRIVKFADRIAYINHDIEDAIRGKIIKKEDLPKDLVQILGDSNSRRINCMIMDTIENSYDKPEIMMSKIVYDAMMKLRKFMFDKVYIGSKAKAEQEKAKKLIEILYEYFYNNLDLLPSGYRELLNIQSKEITVCDYIAGMSDGYAIHLFNTVFVPKSWSIL